MWFPTFVYGVNMKITGEVIKIRYINEENGYSVFDIKTEDGDLKIVGMFDW